MATELELLRNLTLQEEDVEEEDDGIDEGSEDDDDEDDDDEEEAGLEEGMHYEDMYGNSEDVEESYE